MKISFDSDEVKVWVMFLRAHASLMRKMEEALQEAHGVSLPWMDALVQLSLAEGHRMTHTRLSQRLLVDDITPGGVTRMVDRMAKAGLVVRRQSRTDRRASYVVLTEKGAKMLDEIYPVQYQNVVDLFIHHLDKDNTPVVKDFLARVLGEDDKRTAGSTSGPK